jgi:hypothetical protein
MTRNAIPAQNKLLVRYQTTNATKAAGIRIKINRISAIIIKPIMTKAMSAMMSNSRLPRTARTMLP